MSTFIDHELVQQDAAYQLYIAQLELESAQDRDDEYHIRRLSSLVQYYDGMKKGHYRERDIRDWERNCKRIASHTTPFVAATVPSRQEVDDLRLVIVRVPEEDEWLVYKDPHPQRSYEDPLDREGSYVWHLSSEGMWDDRVRHALADEYGTRTPEMTTYE